ncbi:MAG: hypothetical protein ACUVTD_01875 [Nitrososphaerales archaeon]
MSERKIRTTLILDEAVFKKLKQKSGGNISDLANRILRESLFPKGESLFGELKGFVSTKDIVKEEVHEELYR